VTNEWSVDAEQIRAMRPRHVLFICVANSSRSQMAAAIARALAPAETRISCAGTQPAPIHPLAVEVLAELGFDLRDAPSRHVDEIAADDVDVVVTLCDDEVAVAVPARALRVHWPLPDPTQMTGSGARRLEAYRNLRDELVRRLALAFGTARVAYAGVSSHPQR
jgi:arsenate reductase